MSQDPQRLDPRSRLTHGINRQRLTMELRRATRPTTALLVGLLLALVGIGYFVTSVSEIFGRKTYDVRFAVSTAFGVFEGFDDVRFRGVPAGTIVEIERHGAQVVLVARIREEYGPVFRDARAELRPITPLNDVYLDVVDPGTRAAGEVDPEKPLPQERTRTSVTVPDVLDTLDAPTRGNLSRLLDGLGNGLSDRGTRLRQAFVTLAPFLAQVGEVTRELRRREHATRRLVHNASTLTGTLAARDQELERLVRTGATTFTAVKRSRGGLDATLQELAPLMTRLRSSLASVRVVADDVDGALTALGPVADRLPGGLVALRRLAAVLDPAVRSLQRPVRELAPLLSSAGGVVRPLGFASRALLPQVPALDNLTQQLKRCEDGVVGFWQWNASLSKFGDAHGPIPRGNLAFGVPSPGAGAPRREPQQGCTPGKPPRGVPEPEDLH